MSSSLPIYQVLNIADQTFDAQQTARYRLSLRLAADGVSFCLADPDRNTYIQLASFESTGFRGVRRLETRHVAAMLDDVQALHPWMREKFAGVNILFEDCRFSMLPLPLFDPQHYRSIWTFNFPRLATEEVLFTPVPATDAVLLFGLPEGLTEMLSARYPYAKFFHGTFPLLSHFFNKFRNADNQGSVLLNFRNGVMDLIVLRERKLQLINSYPFKSEEDVLYFLLFAVEQTGLNPESAEIHLCGNFQRDSSLHQLIGKYVRNLQLMSRNDDFRYSYLFERVDQHQFFNLLNLNLCE